jgi:hypothetical protein
VGSASCSAGAEVADLQRRAKPTGRSLPLPCQPVRERNDSYVQRSRGRPFRVAFPDEELAELRRRLNATRWPDRETVTDDSQGARLAMTQELARYWATGYDWRTCEAKLNALPNFTTEIDGLDIHFIHARSQHDDAQIMSTRPQTLYGLADSPADLAAFMLDHGDATGLPALVPAVARHDPSGLHLAGQGNLA